MKRKILNIVAVSAIITLIGFLMDGDVKEPSMLMRFTEFFAMVGMVSLLTATFYFTSVALYKNLQRIRA